MRFRSLTVFATLVAVVATASCAEQLDSGSSCPILCPQEAAPLKDTIIDGITFDTSIAGYPALGFESLLLLTKRSDTLETRVIVRFDSLPTTYKFGTHDSTIVRVDSAYLRGFIPASDTAKKFAGDVTIEVYDVTDATPDTAVASLSAQFTPANLIGSLGFIKDDSPDSLTFLLDTARVLSRIQNGQNLRLGLRMVTAGSEEIRFNSSAGGIGFQLFVHPTRDSLVAIPKFPPKSLTPAELPFLRSPFQDFVITTVGAVAPAANLLRVGGFPAHRVLMRFSIPSRIVDSTVVIRATLMLTQTGTKSVLAGDTTTVHIVPIIASSELTDPNEVLQFAASPLLFPLDSLRVVPRDSVVREFQMVDLVRAWRGQDTIKTPRLAALLMSSESQRQVAVDFFSIRAPAGVRPRLRLTYVTRLGTGRP